MIEYFDSDLDTRYHHGNLLKKMLVLYVLPSNQKYHTGWTNAPR